MFFGQPISLAIMALTLLTLASSGVFKRKTRLERPT